MSNGEGGKITGVLANYNHAKYIREAIDSILSQSRPLDRFIIIDDASMDSSVEIISSYLSKTDYMELIRNEKNKGIAEVNNMGLLLTRTEYLVYFAADHIYYPSYIEKACSALDKYRDAALFSAHAKWMDEKGGDIKQFRTFKPKKNGNYYSPDESRRFMIRYGAFMQGCCSIYRTEVLKEIGGFDNKLGAYQDSFARQLLAVKYGMYFSPEEMASWRRHSESFSAQTNKDMKNILHMMRSLEEKFKNDNIRNYFGKDLKKLTLNRMRYAAIQGYINNQTLTGDELKKITNGQNGNLFFCIIEFLSKFLSKKYLLKLFALKLVPRDLVTDIYAYISRRS